jgi:hypothetical protein
MTVTRLLIALVPAAMLAVGNWVAANSLGAFGLSAPVVWLVGSPFLLALAVSAFSPPPAAPVVEIRTAPPPPPGPPPEEGVLRVLGMLQAEGRLVDFLQEDLSQYPDAQVGAGVRGIHEGCRKVLRALVALEPVMRGTEGESVTVEAGFDPAAIRLTGNVQGEPPFRGVLRHAGWRAATASLPSRHGQDPHVIAPAEVEIA